MLPQAKGKISAVYIRIRYTEVTIEGKCTYNSAKGTSKDLQDRAVLINVAVALEKNAMHI